MAKPTAVYGDQLGSHEPSKPLGSVNPLVALPQRQAELPRRFASVSSIPRTLAEEIAASVGLISRRRREEKDRAVGGQG